MKNLFPRLVLLCAAFLSACAVDRPASTPPSTANTRCGELRVSQAGGLLPSDGLSVTVRRAPFLVTYAGASQGSFNVHAASPNSPVGRLRTDTNELWLVDSRSLPREPGDLRLAGHVLTSERSGSYDRGPDYAPPPSHQSSLLTPGKSPTARLNYNAAASVNEAGKRTILIEKVHGQPLEGSKWPVLHLTSLVGAGIAGEASPQKVSWSSCSIFFE